MARKGPLVDAEPVRQHVRELMAAGAGYRSIAAAAGVNVAIINHLLYGQGAKKRTERLIRANACSIMRVRIDQVSTGRVDSTGSVRRLRALMAVGWPSLHIAPHTRLYTGYLKEIQRVDKVYATTAHDVAVAYNRLWNQNPEKHGVSQQAATRLRKYARAQGWAPPGAWDDDTIDDPAATPEWTGYCGTDRGWWSHRLQHIPVCPPCQAAHDQWREELKALPQEEKLRAVGRARAAASTREADLAADAREIKRLCGADDEQAAARLGVTRQHLQQALKRHPAPDTDEQQLAA